MTMPELTIPALLAEAGRLYSLITNDEKGQAIAARNNLQRAILLTSMAQVLADTGSSAIDQAIKGLRDDLSVQQKKTVTQRVGTVSTAALLAINSSVDRTLTWPDGGFPDDNYTVQFLPLSMTGATWAIKAKTATTITVTVTTAGLALAAGATLGVIGLRYA